jgi:capsular exopolysaccharide synthesis family protein
MAKTYEAMLQKNRTADNRNSLLDEWKLLNLVRPKELGDIEKKIDYLREKRGFKIFNFTSSIKRAGVSTIVFHLVRYMADKNPLRRILLFDTNMQHPVLHIAFNVPLEPGLLNLFSGTNDISSVIQKTGWDNVSIITAGNSVSGSNALQENRFREIISSVREEFDCIFIDSAPLLEYSEAISSAGISDVTFLVIEANRTKKEVAEKAKLLLQERDCGIGGAILNRALYVIPEKLYNII